MAKSREGVHWSGQAGSEKKRKGLSCRGVTPACKPNECTAHPVPVSAANGKESSLARKVNRPGNRVYPDLLKMRLLKKLKDKQRLNVRNQLKTAVLQYS